MKKEVISVFDEELDRKATLEEKFGIFVFVALIAPVIIVPLILTILLILLIFGITQK